MTGDKLLIVDDDADVREMIGRFGEALGFQVTTVASGTAFRDAYVDIDPDAVVMDLFMPGEDGLSLLSWLADRGSRARVVMVSGDPEHGRTALDRAQREGLRVVSLKKPFMLDEFEVACA